jgi:sec-independent protein translocase protein TatA
VHDNELDDQKERPMGLDNPLHIVILLGVLVMLFGAKRLPEMGRGLGNGLREFRDSLSGRSADRQGRAASSSLESAVSSSHDARAEFQKSTT